jgi:DNA primase
LADDRVALIKQSNDIVDVVGGYIALRPAGAKFKGLCPFHQDHRPSLDVDPRRQNFRCWSCGKSGDVISFVMEHERVDFRAALELLARRAGISLHSAPDSPWHRSRAVMLEVVGWAATQYHECLMESDLADAARRYLGERQLNGETLRRFGLGFAPSSGNWLCERAARARISDQVLEKVGLLAQRQDGTGFYDRFRDRVMFPIRDGRGQAVGFGGRILPTSPSVAGGAPKYYNSCTTPLFNKSELLYGLDQARQAARSEGYLAVVEGYTDVLMAHQLGISQVVATLGTALNGRHVRQLRRFAPRVVLVFDADAGGDTGVDRALEVFLGQDVDVAIATLPEGRDPCDLLVGEGAVAFRQVLDSAVDALEFKVNQLLAGDARQGIDAQKRAIDALLRVIALAPEQGDEAVAIKRQLVITRIAQRFALREESVRARLEQLRAGLQRPERTLRQDEPESEPARSARAAPEERELLEILLADPELVPVAAGEISPERIQHGGLRALLEGLYELQSEGEEPSLDRLRERIDNPRLAAHALKMREVGLASLDRRGWLEKLLGAFRSKDWVRPKQLELKNQLQAVNDHAAAVGLLRQLQNAD